MDNKKNSKIYFKFKKLKKIDNNFLFTIGTNNIPFDFHFSDQFKQSFEYPFPKKRAYLRYEFCVKLNSFYGSAEPSEYICFKSRPLINEEKLLNKIIN